MGCAITKVFEKCTKRRDNRILPSRSECAICCERMLPCTACRLPCASCYDVEKGYSDKLVCATCSSRFRESNKCPFCNMTMVPVSTSLVTMAEKDEEEDGVRLCQYRNCECRYNPCVVISFHGCKTAITICMVYLMSMVVAAVFTMTICSPTEKVCSTCYAFFPIFGFWTWFMMTKVSCDVKVSDNVNFCVGVCMAVALTLFLSLSYEENCEFNWHILALFLIACPCCSYCTTRTLLEDYDM